MENKQTDVIKIEDLEIYAYHGVYPEENKLGQRFYINAWLYTDTRLAGRLDELSLSTDYGAVCQFMDAYMKENTCRLIEAAAERTAEAVLLHFPLVRELELELRKPSAPIGLPVSSVSVMVRRGWHEAVIALGSNMGNRERYLKEAVEALREHALIQVERVSDYIETPPYGGVEQGDFLNGVLSLKTLLTPQELLQYLQQLEAQAQRVRDIHWGPRTLDLDIIYYDDLILDKEELTIPHPDMHNRRFVLGPLSQIAPCYRHPVLHKTTLQLLKECET